MLDCFTAALARIQSDYEFYIGCQTDPASALAGYDLTPEERSALADPSQLARVLNKDLRPRNIPSITVTISGRHDWVNRAPKTEPKTEPPQQRVVHEVAAIKAARSDEERTQAALQLIERVG
jgi:hypothetical protein